MNPGRARSNVVGLALILLLLTSCGLLSSGEQESSVLATATVRPTAIGTPPMTDLPEQTASAVAPTETGPVTLVLWTSEDYVPSSETGGGTLLLQQIQAFQRAHDVRIQVILKKRSGIGGLLDFLTTASVAAPSVLPDLVTLSEADLYRAAQAGLLQPLNDLVSPDLLEDQFDFAKALTQFEGIAMGVLYQADVFHMVYDATLVQDPPETWRSLYKSPASFVFSPAPLSDGVNDAVLLQYLSLDGTLADGEGRPMLDAGILSQALTFFDQAREAGVVPRAVLDMTDATTAWATFRIGEAGMVQVPSSLYLSERAGLSNAGFGPIPLRDPGFTTIGHGWALALVTQDPQRQELAAALIEHLLSTENNGAWAQAAGHLPAHQAALEAWDQDDPYLPFIRHLLTQAEPAPNPDLAAVIGGPMAEALAQVLSGQATPEEAAQAAAEEVRAEP